MSISCCCDVRVGTGLEDGVGAGATKARRISSVVAIRMKSWSFTIHNLEEENNGLNPNMYSRREFVEQRVSFAISMLEQSI